MVSSYQLPSVLSSYVKNFSAVFHRLPIWHLRSFLVFFSNSDVENEKKSRLFILFRNVFSQIHPFRESWFVEWCGMYFLANQTRIFIIFSNWHPIHWREHSTRVLDVPKMEFLDVLVVLEPQPQHHNTTITITPSNVQLITHISY